ncbi:MAG: hypothetical protein ABIQ95_04760 [Bdellovibrionia bacterium]
MFFFLIFSLKSYAEVCPYQKPEEWQTFIKVHAERSNWVETCEDSACDEDFYEFVKNNVQHTFEVCADFIARHESINRCTENMRKFTPAWLQQHSGDSYGFTVDNHTYLSEQEAKDKPTGMMIPPKAIVAALPNRKKVEAAARKNGWKYLTHDSALGGVRTFVFIPDVADRFDQWLLLNLQEGSSSVSAGAPMSLLTVQKKDRAGNFLAEVRLHFRDYTLQSKAKGYGFALNEENNGKCFSCHSNGVRQLIPRKTPVLEGQPVLGEKEFVEKTSRQSQFPVPAEFPFQRLLEFNRKLRSYGTPNWDGKVLPENHGPALGKDQGCLDCHDGKTRGTLTVITSSNQLEQKILHELSMPPDTGLSLYLERKEMKNPMLSTEEEKFLKLAFDTQKKLNHEFKSSRYPTLKKWFLEKTCH